MKKLVFIFLFLSHGPSSMAQKRNMIWCFGDSAGIDFNNGAVPLVSRVDSRGSCASIADTTGNLLFYSAYDRTAGISGTDPVKVYDKMNNVMQNGDSIKGGGWYRETVITQNPGNNDLFYLFNIGVTLDYGFYYAEIDMSQNGGLGAVIQKNIQLQTFQCSDGLTAIKHGNGRDWWVLFRRSDMVNDEYYKYLVSPSGISNVVVQHIGSSTINGFGKLRFSPNGNKIAMITYLGLLEILDFDRCSGLLSNPVTIHPEPTSSPYQHFWSAAFSPNGRFLYVTAYFDTCYLYQYDLQSANPAATRITLDTITNDLIAIGNVGLAPDGRIYLSNAWECQAFPYCYPYPDSVYNYVNMNLSVINYPDSLGAACGYAPYSFYLNGHRTYVGLPNNPDYDMPRLQGSSCDTIQWAGVNEQLIMDNGQLFVSYISSWQKAFVNAKNLKGKNCVLTILDIDGRIIFSSEKKAQPPYFTMNVSCAGFAKGMYIARLQTEKEMLVKKFVIN